MLPLHSSSHLLSLNKQPFPALPTHSSQCYQRPGHSQADTHLPLCSHFIPSQRLNNGSRCSLPVLNKIFCYVCCVIGSLPLFAFLLESCDSTSIWQCPNVCPVHRLPRYSKMVQVFQNADSLWTNHSLWVKEINLVSADFREWDMSPFCKKKKTTSIWTWIHVSVWDLMLNLRDILMLSSVLECIHINEKLAFPSWVFLFFWMKFTSTLDEDDFQIQKDHGQINV